MRIGFIIEIEGLGSEDMRLEQRPKWRSRNSHRGRLRSPELNRTRAGSLEPKSFACCNWACGSQHVAVADVLPRDAMTLGLAHSRPGT